MEKQIPHPFGIDDIRFMQCFTAPSYRIFVALLIGWALTVGKHSISQVILTMRLHDSRHFATIYRFLGKSRWNLDLVSCCLFRVMLETLIAEETEVLTVIDDTLNKHCGRSICGAGWQHDGSAKKHSGQTGYGVCFVIIGMVVRLSGISDRMFCLPFAARLWWPPKTKVKPQGLAYRKKPELALDLIKQTHSWLVDGKRLRVVGDLGYCCDTVLKGRPKDVHVTGRLRGDSALFSLVEAPTVVKRGRPRKRGYRLGTPWSMFEDVNLKWTQLNASCYGKQIRFMVHRFTALWYHSAGQEAISVVLCRDMGGRHGDRVFFDTDIDAETAQVIERYGARWSIEVTNRETKQLLGAGEPQCRKELSVIRSPMFAYWSYSFVVLWFVRQFAYASKLVSTPAPWYRHKKSFTFSDMLVAARRSHFSTLISSEATYIDRLHKINQSRFTRGFNDSRIAKL